MPINKETKAKMQRIRGFVDFDYDLRKELHPNSIRKIDRYYDYINEKLSDNSNIRQYKPKTKKRLNKALKASGAPPELKGLKVALLSGKPSDKISFNNRDELVQSNEFVKAAFIPLDPNKIIGDDAESYINKVLKPRKFKQFQIKFGEFDDAARSKGLIAAEVIKLTTKYNKDDGHHYENWLSGVTGLSFQNQKPKREYLANKKKAAKARASATAKRKRREKRNK